MKKLCFLLILSYHTVVYLKPFNVNLSPQKLDTSIKSLNDFPKFEAKLLDIIEQYKKVVASQTEKREQFLEENKNNPDLIDFINFLISEDIIQPNTSIEIKKIDKNSWCNHPELIDQITTFFNTGMLPAGEDPKDLHSLYNRILAFIPEGPLQTPFKTLHLPNFSTLLENIKRYQRALVGKVRQKILNPASAALSGLKKDQHATATSISREAQMFSTAMAFFYLWAEKPQDKLLENDFIKFANMYYREYPAHFEKIRSYLREKIKTVVAAKLDTLDAKKVNNESLRIERKITKTGWWQFWK